MIFVSASSSLSSVGLGSSGIGAGVKSSVTARDLESGGTLQATTGPSPSLELVAESCSPKPSSSGLLKKASSLVWATASGVAETATDTVELTKIVVEAVTKCGLEAFLPTPEVESSSSASSAAEMDLESGYGGMVRATNVPSSSLGYSVSSSMLEETAPAAAVSTEVESVLVSTPEVESSSSVSEGDDIERGISVSLLPPSSSTPEETTTPASMTASKLAIEVAQQTGETVCDNAALLRVVYSSIVPGITGFGRETLNDNLALIRLGCAVLKSSYSSSAIRFARGLVREGRETIRDNLNLIEMGFQTIPGGMKFSVETAKDARNLVGEVMNVAQKRICDVAPAATVPIVKHVCATLFDTVHLAEEVGGSAVVLLVQTIDPHETASDALNSVREISEPSVSEGRKEFEASKRSKNVIFDDKNTVIEIPNNQVRAMGTTAKLMQECRDRFYGDGCEKFWDQDDWEAYFFVRESKRRANEQQRRLPALSNECDDVASEILQGRDEAIVGEDMSEECASPVLSEGRDADASEIFEGCDIEVVGKDVPEERTPPTLSAGRRNDDDDDLAQVPTYVARSQVDAIDPRGPPPDRKTAKAQYEREKKEKLMAQASGAKSVVRSTSNSQVAAIDPRGPPPDRKKAKAQYEKRLNDQKKKDLEESHSNLQIATDPRGPPPDPKIAKAQYEQLLKDQQKKQDESMDGEDKSEQRASPLLSGAEHEESEKKPGRHVVIDLGVSVVEIPRDQVNVRKYVKDCTYRYLDTDCWDEDDQEAENFILKLKQQANIGRDDAASAGTVTSLNASSSEGRIKSPSAISEGRDDAASEVNEGRGACEGRDNAASAGTVTSLNTSSAEGTFKSPSVNSEGRNDASEVSYGWEVSEGRDNAASAGTVTSLNTIEEHMVLMNLPEYRWRWEQAEKKKKKVSFWKWFGWIGS